MNKIKQLFNNKVAKASSFYFLGNIFNKSIAFTTIPIFTRLMTTSDYGMVNTYLSWVGILSLIVGLSLGSSIRSAYLDFKEDLNGYVSSIFILSFLNFIISSGIILGICYFFIDQIDLFLVILCLIQSFMSFIINCISIKNMMAMAYIKNTLLTVIPNIFIAMLSILFLLFMKDSKYLALIFPYIIVFSIVALIYFFKYLLIGKKFFGIKYWKYAITLSIPLIFHGLSLNVLSTSDRTMITIFRSASETGVYSIVYNLSMISLVATSALGSVWVPWFNRKLQNNERDVINKNVRLYIEIVLICMIAILMIGPEVLVLMSPEEYWGGKVLIGPIVLASFFIFIYSISVDLEYYYKSTKIIALNTMIAAFLNLALNFIFIPKYGALGAAFTTVLAYIVSFGIHYRAARKLDHLLFPFKIYIKPITIMLTAISASYLLMDFIVTRWIITVFGLCFYAVLNLRGKRFEELLSK